MAKRKNSVTVQQRITCYIEWLNWFKNRRK